MSKASEQLEKLNEKREGKFTPEKGVKAQENLILFQNDLDSSAKIISKSKVKNKEVKLLLSWFLSILNQLDAASRQSSAM